MKNIFFILFVCLGLVGCASGAEEDLPMPQKSVELEIPKLNRPDVILNELAKGEFHNGVITSINLKYPSGPNREWFFETSAGKNKISRIVMPEHDDKCEVSTVDFVYNSQNLIQEVISVRPNTCFNFVNKWAYTYKYEEGLLVGIKGMGTHYNAGVESKNYFMCDRYFSYYPNGKVSTIYSSFRDAAQPSNYGFQKTSLVYNEKGNITEVTREFHDSPYKERYTIDYDDAINPLKGIYLLSSEQAWLPAWGFASGLGPRFLSNNCVKSIRTEELYTYRPAKYEYFDYTILENKVIDFGDSESTAQGLRFMIKYAN